jgi:hypothetical protein
VDNQPPYQEMPSGTPPPPPGPGFTHYPGQGSQGYAPSGPGYGPPPGYPPPGSGYGSPPGYVSPGPAFVPPPVYAPAMGVYVSEIPDPGKGMAIAGFVLGIISVCLVCTLYGALANILIGGLGIIFSAMGRKSRTGHGLAIAGLVMSIIGVVVAAIWVAIIIIAIIASAATPDY